MSLFLRKTKNLLEYLHPKHLGALLRGVPADERKTIRKSLRPQPASGKVRQETLREYAARYGCRILIETGTFRGDMIAAQLDYFNVLHSIELAPHLHAAAVERFKDHSKVTIHLGDSATVLPKLLETIDEPCLFWLDGHASGGETARGKELTPIIHELETILKHPVKNHAILIDDAREFGPGKGYPSLSKVRKLVSQTYPHFEVSRDIIRITATRPAKKG